MEKKKLIKLEGKKGMEPRKGSIKLEIMDMDADCGAIRMEIDGAMTPPEAVFVMTTAINLLTQGGLNNG